MAPQDAPRYRLMLDDPHVRWFSAEHAREGFRVHGRGYAFVNDICFCGQNLVDAAYERTRRPSVEAAVSALKELIPTLNGCWALVAEWPNGQLLAATDRLRTIPLFYAQRQGALLLSSSIYRILDEIPKPLIQDQAAVEFLLAGYVTGADTLYEGVRQIQSGEMLEFGPHQDNAYPTTHRYYRFLPHGDSDADEAELERQLEMILDRVFSKYARALGSEEIVVPLSGGLDSRLVVAMLKRHGVEDVLCFSYGLRGNDDTSRSQAVARALGYDWQGVEYNAEEWAKWMSSPEMEAYWKYSMQGTSLPHFQDLPAVAVLTGRGSVHAGVFLPGYGGDTLSGSHIHPELNERGGEPELADIASSILRHHFILWGSSEEIGALVDLRQTSERLLSQLRWNPPGQAYCSAARYEMWDIENRQAKFIVNSVRAYQFYSHKWALPLWDHELMDFFVTVPQRLRFRQRLYIMTLKKRVFIKELEKLRLIPLATGHLPRHILSERKHRSRQVALRVFDVLCLGNMVRRINRHLASPAPPLGFQSWFAEGRDPRAVKIREVFKRMEVTGYLPASLLRLVEPHLDRSLADIFCNGVLSAVTVAHVFKGAFQPRQSEHGVSADAE